MTNPEHLAKLREGVEAWNRWREENSEIAPDLQGANLRRAQLEEANFNKVHLESADLSGARLYKAKFEGAWLDSAQLKKTNLIGAQLNRAKLIYAQLESANLYDADLKGVDLRGAQLEKINLRGARLVGADLTLTNLEEANLHLANLEKVDLRGANLENSRLASANLSRADLRDCTGLRFDNTNILHARLTKRPGKFFRRLLPWFIYNPSTDPWSELRRAYTGPNFLITLLALIAFLLPYVFQIATWSGINLAQELMQSTLTDVRQDYETLVASGEVPPAAPPLERALARLESYDTCLAQTCERYRIWQLLLGWNKGWLFVVMTLAIIIYNLIRYHLTQKISAFREEEERSGYTPALSEYFTPNLFGIYSDSTKAPTWLRRIVPIIGLSPTRLHVVLRILFLLASTAFAFNLYDVLSTVVNLRP